MKLLIAKLVVSGYSSGMGTCTQMADRSWVAHIPLGDDGRMVEVQVLDVQAAFEIEEEK